MKKAIIFLVVFIASLSGSYAQKGTFIYLDKEKGLNGMTIGSDFSTISKNGLQSVSEIDTAIFINFYNSRKFFLNDEEIKIHSFAIQVYHHKIFDINVSFSEDGAEMLKKLISLYGGYTSRRKNMDVYNWQSDHIFLTINYVDPKDKYLNFIDFRQDKKYQDHMDSLKSNTALKLFPGDSTLHRSKYFIAMQYKGFSNCIYKVFITDSLIMCAKVNGYITIEPTFGLYTSIPKKKMHDPEAYINNKLEAKYHDLSDVKSFLNADRLNFIIRVKDIKNVFNVVTKKWGMGYYPYGGRIFIQQFSTSVPNEFILVGDQDPNKILAILNRR